MKKTNLLKLILTFVITTSVLLLGGCLSDGGGSSSATPTQNTTQATANDDNNVINIGENNQRIVIYKDLPGATSDDSNTVAAGSHYFTFDLPDDMQERVSWLSGEHDLFVDFAEAQNVQYSVDSYFIQGLSGNLPNYMEENFNGDYHTVTVNGKTVYYATTLQNIEYAEDADNYTILLELEDENDCILEITINDFEHLPIKDLITKYVAFTDKQWESMLP
jgi:hypothetical protein